MLLDPADAELHPGHGGQDEAGAGCAAGAESPGPRGAGRVDEAAGRGHGPGRQEAHQRHDGLHRPADRGQGVRGPQASR